MHKLFPILVVLGFVIWAITATGCVTKVVQVPTVVRTLVIHEHHVVPMVNCGEVVDCYYEDPPIEGSI